MMSMTVPSSFSALDLLSAIFYFSLGVCILVMGYQTEIYNSTCPLALFYHKPNACLGYL